jgi:hypothetical protein
MVLMTIAALVLLPSFPNPLAFNNSKTSSRKSGQLLFDQSLIPKFWPSDSVCQERSHRASQDGQMINYRHLTLPVRGNEP